MIREILEACQPGFAEVVLMLANNGATAEVYTMFEDLRFAATSSPSWPKGAPTSICT